MNQLEYIGRQLMIVAGITMIIFGLIGNILNICVFFNWSRSRVTTNNQLRKIQTSNSPLYLFTSSIANIMVITYSLTTRILFDGYQYPVTQSNMVYLCKLRYYVLHTFDTISWTCLCMAMFDRYLVSSREVRLRQLIPIIMFTLFGFLTYKQLKMIRNRQNTNKNMNVDKQLSRMFLLMSATVVLSAIPYTVETIYYLIFANSSQQQTSYVLFFHIISSILFYTNAVCSFYVYYISTPNFRIQVHKIIFCQKDLNRFMNNQVNTMTTAQQMY
ncbi:unnamed protein product [Rotaria sp. Silwood1]|nr:unnamed protein product [Rotaria sp. Silwood1]